MKKGLILGLALMMAASVSFAAEKKMAASSSSTGNWVIQIAGDAVVPVGDAANTYDLGFGGEALVGYAVDSNLTIGVLSGYQDLLIKGSPSGVSAGYIPIEGVVQYSLGNDKVKPYGVLGAGLAINNVSSSLLSVSESDFLLDPGVGVSFELSDKTNLFVQGKVALDFTTGTTSIYIPLQVGVNFGI